jgi:phosphinothricin acetyltransferase
MSDLRIRPASPADIPAVTAIYAHSVLTGTASFELEPPAEAEMARRRLVLVEAGYPYVVATQGEILVGYAYAGAYRPRPGYRNTVEDSVYVAPAAQGRGAGGLLLKTIIDQCIARGFRQMIAVIGDTANAASIRLHRTHGFATIGTLAAVGWKHGRWVDSVLMQRPLGDGSISPPAG